MQDFPQGVMADGEGGVPQDAFGLEKAGQAAEGCGYGEEQFFKGTVQCGFDCLGSGGDFYQA